MFFVETKFLLLKYSSQHLKWIKKVLLGQERILILGFRTTLMKGFDPLQMLTSFNSSAVV